MHLLIIVRCSRRCIHRETQRGKQLHESGKDADIRVKASLPRYLLATGPIRVTDTEVDYWERTRSPVRRGPGQPHARTLNRPSINIYFNQYK